MNKLFFGILLGCFVVSGCVRTQQIEAKYSTAKDSPRIVYVIKGNDISAHRVYQKGHAQALIINSGRSDTRKFAGIVNRKIEKKFAEHVRKRQEEKNKIDAIFRRR